MNYKAPRPNAPVVWIVTGLACFCICAPFLCFGWFFRVWEPEDPTMTVRIYDPSLTKPDMNSLQNLVWDKLSPNEFWLSRAGDQTQIGFLAKDGYHLLSFDPSTPVSEREMKTYFKRSESGAKTAGLPIQGWLSVNINQSGEVLSPFRITSLRIVPVPNDAKFLDKVE